ncbi:MAG: PhzF family phenazine biosynthesis protein [Gemmatimonadota bacterium]|nr:PhzF family phenazine biosynthesis protein [Gemmatimonadota bacterium]
MRAHAKRLGAEVAFVLPTTRADCLARLRYFVTETELSMCVHATIASVTVLARRGRIARVSAGGTLIESPLGPRPVTWTEDNNGLAVTSCHRARSCWRIRLPAHWRVLPAGGFRMVIGVR